MRKNGFFAVLTSLAVLAGVPAQSQEGWSFQITPYAWMSGLEGDIGTFPGLPAGSVDLSFRDILDNLQFAGMILASARTGPWVFYLDATHSDLSSTEKNGGVVIDRIKIDSKTSTLALAAGREIHKDATSSAEAYIGARAWWLDNRFEVIGPGGGSNFRREKENWVSPLVGLTGRYSLSERWTLFGAAEVGGFGVGADSEWSLLFGGTYNVSDKFAVNIGWRHLEVDYDDNGVVYDVGQSGPLIGASFRF